MLLSIKELSTPAQRHPIGIRVLLAVVGLVIAPVAAIWAAGKLPNPPGTGPGAGQVVVGVAVPLVLTLVPVRAAGLGRVEGVAWVIASLAATGALVLFILWFVSTYLTS